MYIVYSGFMSDSNSIENFNGKIKLENLKSN